MTESNHSTNEKEDMTTDDLMEFERIEKEKAAKRESYERCDKNAKEIVDNALKFCKETNKDVTLFLTIVDNKTLHDISWTIQADNSPVDCVGGRNKNVILTTIRNAKAMI